MKKSLLFIAVLLLSVFLISCDETSTKGNLPIETPEKSEITEEVPNETDTTKEDEVEPEIHEHLYSQKNIDEIYLKSNATCTESLTYYYSCSCGEKGEETFTVGTAAGHSFGDWQVFKEATYTEEGIKRKTCSACGINEDVSIEKLVKPKEEKPATPVVKEEKPTTPTVKEEVKQETKPSSEINVPAIEKKELSIEKITQTSTTIAPAEFVTINGSISQEDQVDVYTFIPERDGRYNFEFSGMKSGFGTWFYIYNDLGEKIGNFYGSNNQNQYVDLTANKTYTIRVSHYENLGDYTLKIGVQKETVDVSKYTSIKDSIEYRNQKNNYTFTVSRDGRYNFEFSGMKSGFGTWFYIYNDLGEKIGNFYGSNNQNQYVDLTANKTYTIRVSHYENLGDYTLNIGIQKETVNVSKYTSIKDSIEYCNQKNNYTFTVSRDGRYNFEFSGMKSGFNTWLYIFNDLGEEVGRLYGSNGQNGYVDLTANKTYTIRVSHYKNLGDYTLNIGIQKPEVNINSTSIVNDSIEYTNQRNVYNFTATKSGTHTITITGLEQGNKVQLIAFNELDENIGENSYCTNNGKITLKDLKQGETYEIQVRYSNAKTKYKLTVN